MRQIHQATGKNRDRVERALMIPVSENLSIKNRQRLQEDYRGTHVFVIKSPDLKTLFTQTQKTTKSLAFSPGTLYLIDPLGNIMMYYPQNIAPKGILKDLEHLLKVSQIG
jgi:hypothetical protein